MLEFKSIGGREAGDPDARVRKRAALIVALGAHVALFGLLLWLVAPLPILFENRRVADVRIIPMDQIHIPDLTGERSDRAASRGEGPAPNETPPGRIADAVPRPAAVSGAAPQASSAPPSAAAAAIMGRFRLSVPLTDPEKLPVGEGLVLSPYAANPWFPTSPDMEKLPEVDLSRYAGSRGSGMRDLFVETLGAPTPRRGGVSVGGMAVDLGPWAEQVVAEIQKNWFLSPKRETAIAGKIIVKAEIGRRGEIRKLTVMSPSGTEELDEAALKALRIAPLPELPEPFPGDRLEVRLVFEVK